MVKLNLGFFAALLITISMASKTYADETTLQVSSLPDSGRPWCQKPVKEISITEDEVSFTTEDGNFKARPANPDIREKLIAILQTSKSFGKELAVAKDDIGKVGSIILIEGACADFIY